MPFKIVRNDITKMNTEAIVNTANEEVTVGSGCDYAVYKAAGLDELLEYRRANVGVVPEGEVFITPGFKLPCKYIIHAVSPLFLGGEDDEEAKLRACYKKSLFLAKEKGIKSIAFPLISTGGFGYPKEEGMRIAVDEINAFLLSFEMDVTLVVFDDRATSLGGKLFPDLEEYIDLNYVDEASEEEYTICYNRSRADDKTMCLSAPCPSLSYEDEVEELNKKLDERLSHTQDTFSEYLLYLIESKGMKNADVYNRAIVSKQYFSKIKTNRDFHPEKIKALCLCVGAKLNLDETKDLLARAGYALSPCDLTDIIFSFYIENEHYDVIDIDIQLEEHGLACVI